MLGFEVPESTWLQLVEPSWPKALIFGLDLDEMVDFDGKVVIYHFPLIKKCQSFLIKKMPESVPLGRHHSVKLVITSKS